MLRARASRVVVLEGAGPFLRLVPKRKCAKAFAGFVVILKWWVLKELRNERCLFVLQTILSVRI